MKCQVPKCIREATCKPVVLVPISKTKRFPRPLLLVFEGVCTECRYAFNAREFVNIEERRRLEFEVQRRNLKLHWDEMDVAFMPLEWRGDQKKIIRREEFHEISDRVDKA